MSYYLNWGNSDEKFEVKRVVGGWILKVKTKDVDEELVFTDRIELGKTIEYLIGVRRHE